MREYRHDQRRLLRTGIEPKVVRNYLLIQEFFLKYFLTTEVELEFSKEDSTVDSKVDTGFVPDIAELADGLKSCFR